MPQWIVWGVTVAALLGTVLNICKRRESFALWIFTNGLFATHNILIREWAQASLFSVYVGLAVWGWFAWREGAKCQAQ